MSPGSSNNSNARICPALDDALEAMRAGGERVLRWGECDPALVNARRVDRGTIVGLVFGVALGCAVQATRLNLIVRQGFGWTTADVVWIGASLVLGGVIGVAAGVQVARRTGFREFWLLSHRQLLQLWVRDQRTWTRSVNHPSIATIQRIMNEGGTSHLVCWPPERADPASRTHTHPVAVISGLDDARDFERELRAAAALDRPSALEGGVADDDVPDPIREECDADERVLWHDVRHTTGRVSGVVHDLALALCATAIPCLVALTLLIRALLARGVGASLIVVCVVACIALWLLLAQLLARRLVRELRDTAPDAGQISCYAVTDRRGLIVHSRGRSTEKFELSREELCTVGYQASGCQVIFPRSIGYIERLQGQPTAIDKPPAFGSRRTFGWHASMPIDHDRDGFVRAIQLHASAAVVELEEHTDAN